MALQQTYKLKGDEMLTNNIIILDWNSDGDEDNPKYSVQYQ